MNEKEHAEQEIHEAMNVLEVQGYIKREILKPPACDTIKKRTWHWFMKPQSYEMTCDLCGGSNLAWSEFEDMIWCYDCQKDTPGQGGLFNGPIPVGLCLELGFSFDRIDLETGSRLYLHRDAKGNCEWKSDSVIKCT